MAGIYGRNGKDYLEMNEPDDIRETAALFMRGDKKAFEKLVLKFRNQAYFIALGFVGNGDDAMDISQEAFIKMYNSRSHFDAKQAFFPWFYEILKNTALNFLRKRKNILNLRSAVAIEEEENIVFNPEVLEEKDKKNELVWAALAKLDPDHREILSLKHFQNLSYDEISGILKIPKGTVMSRLYYARLKLKNLLQAEIEKENHDR